MNDQSQLKTILVPPLSLDSIWLLKLHFSSMLPTINAYICNIRCFIGHFYFRRHIHEDLDELFELVLIKALNFELLATILEASRRFERS